MWHGMVKNVNERVSVSSAEAKRTSSRKDREIEVEIF